MNTLAKEAAPTVSDAATPLSGPTLARGIGYLLAAVSFLLGARLIADNSFFTHLATGRLIIETGSVPTVDPYSATAVGEAWTVQSWLASLIYAVLEQGLGAWSLRVFNGLLCLWTTRILWRLTDRISNIVYRTALVSAPVVVGAVMWSPRPLLFGLVGLALVLEVVSGRRASWQLVPIMWIWVNTHGSFPLAGVAVGTIMVGRWLESRAMPRADMRVFGWVCLGTLLGALNPLGLRLLTFPVELLGRREALEGVNEWGPPSVGTIEFAAFAGLLLAAAWLGWRHRAWAVVVPTVVFGLSGFLALRNIPTASIVMLAVVAPLIGRDRGLVNGELRGLLPRALTGLSGAVLAMSIIAAVSQGAFDLDSYPVDAVDFLEANDLVANPGVTLVHTDDAGNYLELRYGGEAGVFIDDRYDFFPLELVKDHLTLVREDSGLDVLDTLDADVVLWTTNSVLERNMAARSMAAEAGWNVVYRDAGWFVACRTPTCR